MSMNGDLISTKSCFVACEQSVIDSGGCECHNVVINSIITPVIQQPEYASDGFGKLINDRSVILPEEVFETVVINLYKYSEAIEGNICLPTKANEMIGEGRALKQFISYLKTLKK